MAKRAWPVFLFSGGLQNRNQTQHSLDEPELTQDKHSNATCRACSEGRENHVLSRIWRATALLGTAVLGNPSHD
eukprot:5523004-Amphidinium_carterae.1